MPITQQDRAAATLRELVIQLEQMEPEDVAVIRETPAARLLMEWINRPAHRQAALIEGVKLGLEAAADWFSDRFSEAVQADCENGVKCLNERAARAYLKDAPDTLAAIHEGEEAIRALDPTTIAGGE